MPAYRLTFMLPRAWLLLAQPGRHQPCLHGCVLTVAPCGLVAIEGGSREQVLNQAARFLRTVGRETIAGRAPVQTIAAELATPPRPTTRDGWSIIVGADVAFSPTSLAPHLVPAESGSAA